MSIAQAGRDVNGLLYISNKNNKIILIIFNISNVNKTKWKKCLSRTALN